MNPTYIAITPYKTGTYDWAMDQLNAGNQVRRFHWPIEVIDDGADIGYTRIWRLYKVSPTTIAQGFNPGVSGADNDAWGDLGTDSGCYYPSKDDLVAMDWQFLSGVTEAQIYFLNMRENRLQRIPNAAVFEFDDRMKVNARKWTLVFCTISACAVLTILYFVIQKMLHHG